MAVLPEPTAVQFSVSPKDLHWQACCSGGPGGQSVNTAKSAVQLTYIPTGLMVRSETERSQLRNKELALALLTSRLWQAAKDKSDSVVASSRRQQIGTGMRGGKRRTVRERDNQVHDHITGQRWTYKDYVKGNW